MTYVLISIICAGTACSQMSAEFYSQSSCVEAIKIIKNELDTKRSVSIICVKK